MEVLKGLSILAKRTNNDNSCGIVKSDLVYTYKIEMCVPLFIGE